MIVLQEPGILKQVVDQGSVITIHGRAKETDKAGNVELESCPCECLRGFLQHGLIKGLIALDDFDFDFGMFLESSRVKFVLGLVNFF
jgi:hypothetical protein